MARNTAHEPLPAILRAPYLQPPTTQIQRVRRRRCATTAADDPHARLTIPDGRPTSCSAATFRNVSYAAKLIARLVAAYSVGEP